MRFCALASGSEGNSAFLSTPSTRILIDAGLSVKELSRRMAEIGERPEDLTAILVTHEHNDHVAGLVRLVRHVIKRGRAIPVYLTRMTSEMLDWNGLESPPIQYFRPGAKWSIGDIGVESFTVPHDATDPLAFAFTDGLARVGVATDLGYIPDALRARFRGAQALLIESNHDVDLLMSGDYPECVKKRVVGDNGHLSNAAIADFIERDLDSTVRTLILGHVSKGNNTEDLILSGASEALRMRGFGPELIIASQDRPTGVIEL